MTKHNLKIWPEFFEDVANGKKTFELRKDDRGFAVGDTLLLDEFRPLVGEYTGRSAIVTITYIMRSTPNVIKIGLPPGYCIMGIERETLALADSFNAE